MEQESSTFIRIFNWKKDRILLSYSDNFKSWEIYHLGDDEVRLYIFTAYIVNVAI